MSIHKTEAIVLARYDLRETSMLVNFYSRDFGKITAEVKGIRSEPDKFASNLEIFSLNEIIFYRKRNSSVHLLSQADKRENFDAIRRDVFKTGIANFMLELTAALMAPEDKNEEVFNLCAAALQELKDARFPEKIALIFKIKMLALSGFKPHLDSCLSCQQKILGDSRFSLALGGLLCPNCYAKDLSSRAIFRGTVASILHIEKNDFKNNLNLGINPEIKKELGMILNSFINYHLEKELKSQKVLNKLAVGV
jgi:DNA repair protein RecO (recombination protein O)